MLVTKQICLSRHSQKYACRDKPCLSQQLFACFAPTKDMFCRDRHVFCRERRVFVATKMVLVAAPASVKGRESEIEQVRHLSGPHLSTTMTTTATIETEGRGCLQ